MVNMGMAEHDRIDTRGIEREWFAVAALVFVAALNQTTIQQNLGVARLHQMARAGDLFRCAEKLNVNLHIHSRLLSRCLETRPA